MRLEWQITGEGARLVRVYAHSPVLELPHEIQGRPLTQIGPYCFSPREPAPKGEVFTCCLGEEGPLTPYAGNYPLRLTLPDTVELVDSAAFYNCRKLEELTVGPRLRQLGSDLFSNCFALRRLNIAALPDSPTGLRKLLGAISTDLEVRFQGAALYYPEYSEQIDENAPAHVFNHTIYGEGYRYRQCFSGDAVSYGEYDATFEREKASETPENMCRLALGRLEYPHKLSDHARQLYLDYLSQNSAVALKLLVAQQDGSRVGFFMNLGAASREALDAGMDLALKRGYAEMSALLMDWQRRLFAPKKKSYSLDDF